MRERCLRRVNLKVIVDDKLKELYSNKIPEIVRNRVKEELDLITKLGIEYQYVIAYEISEKVKKDNRIMLDRVCGNSYIAYLLGISIVNPLEYNISIYDNNSILCTFDLDFEKNYFHDIFDYTITLFKRYGVEVATIDDLKIHNFYLGGLSWCYIFGRMSKYIPIHDIPFNDKSVFEYLKNNEDSVIYDAVSNFKEYDLKEEPFHNIYTLSKFVAAINTTIDDKWKMIDFNKYYPIFREDIYDFLKSNDLETIAFEFMNFIGKGKSHSKFHSNAEKWNEYKKILKEHNISDDYIAYCSNIDYLWPKSACVNRALVYYFSTYYKIYFPKEYAMVIDDLHNFRDLHEVNGE